MKLEGSRGHVNVFPFFSCCHEMLHETLEEYFLCLVGNINVLLRKLNSKLSAIKREIYSPKGYGNFAISSAVLMQSCFLNEWIFTKPSEIVFLFELWPEHATMGSDIAVGNVL